MAIYGYARCSTAKQDPERQFRNIRSIYPTAKFFFDAYTGTKMEGRKDWNRLMKLVKPGDTIIFDGVARMSRNADEGVAAYKELFNKGVKLEFIKEPHINSEIYSAALQTQVPLTGTDADAILEGVNKYLLIVAEKQIRIAFEQAEAEVMRLRQRTSEGIVTAKANGKTVGRKEGSTYNTKKSIRTKKMILNLSQDFGGVLKDAELIPLIGVSRHTFYKYKTDLKIQHGMLSSADEEAEENSKDTPAPKAEETAETENSSKIEV